MAETTVKAILDTASDKKKSGDSIEAKEFFWDQFVKYLGSAILALVVLEVSVDFFRGGRVSCFHPADTFSVLHPNLLTAEEVYQFGRDQAAFLNSFCVSSIPVTEYFPLYIIIHGLLIIAPHYIWTSIHKGDFDSFFSIAEKMERLRRSETGEYSEENFNRVSKLEKEYGGHRRQIFLTYILKLVVQLCVCVVSAGFSGGYLTDFSFSFNCPRSLAEDGTIPDGWPLNGTVSCVYVSLRILRIIRVSDFVLTALAGVLIIYGLLWSVVRHTEELGHCQVANFVFQSYLKPEDFEFPPVLRFGKQRPLKLLLSEFEVSSALKYLAWFCAHKIVFKFGSSFRPGVRSDFDFLILTLFRSDSSYGRVFKNVQVTMELRRLLGRDHQLLHLYLIIQNDVGKFNRQKDSRAAIPGETEWVNPWDHTVKEERFRTCWSYVCSLFNGRYRRNDHTAIQANGHYIGPNGSLSNHARLESGLWEKRRAICLLSVCCCCFRRKKREKHIQKTGINLSEMEHRIKDDYRNLFQFVDDPEKSTYNNFTSHLGNIKLLHQGDEAGMRQMIYLLVKVFGRPRSGRGEDHMISNDVALDIAFGSFGYFLVLARAFKSVFSINFHPYFRNPETVVKEDVFYTNYHIITYPDNIYATSQGDINMANILINTLLADEKTRKRMVDMIVIGPIRDEHHKVSVNILLSTAKRNISKDALLLAVRPLRIGRKKCVFFKYEPPKRFFEKYDIWSKLSDEQRKKVYAIVDEEPCFKLTCSEVTCIFEFQAYYYIGDIDHNLEHTMSPNPQPQVLPSPVMRSRNSEEGDEEEHVSVHSAVGNEQGSSKHLSPSCIVRSRSDKNASVSTDSSNSVSGNSQQASPSIVRVSLT